ncbi:CDP-diacylglycerol--glycerol-3-phosphate 3-phosphatidyltransferase [Allopseudospirillum japonicum]|uniref:CDP-diacylglycerol--glycerol-3-phosphate 3-phosphatidyltransferase n=1 Tax=Allopseudospirillum japonicum TaxID=64971 RepID=UPI000B814A97|nr:CDP-diacylglycerol--glycerol-3-phosphate 3-phosphatidyltransferase [Allopseudospirillum japonicum]
MNVPTLLTLLRILLIPLLVVVYYLPIAWAALFASAIFILAAITDWLDGYLARRWNQTTPFGAFLDPVADKLIVAVALGVLIETHASLWMTAPALIIIGREIVISALREWMAELGQRAQVAVSSLGKWKTSLQMIAIGMLLAFEPGHVWACLGLLLLYIAAVLTLWSMFIYLKVAWPMMRPSLAMEKN